MKVSCNEKLRTPVNSRKTKFITEYVYVRKRFEVIFCAKFFLDQNLPSGLDKTKTTI